jgi:ParB family chromosome partitioning protein
MTTTEQPRVYEALDVDPTTLVIAPNERKTVVLDDEFISSIAKRGVLEPVIAYRVGDGPHTVFRVLRGQRRTLGAIKAKRPTVPVFVVPEPDAETDRIIDQLVENFHRAGMTAGDTARSVEQLALLGLTDEQIEEGLALQAGQVRAARRTARSKLAAAAAEQHDFLTLDHLAAIAEFEDDPKAVETLTISAQNGRFEHALQRLRDERDERAAIEAKRAELAAAGPITLLDAQPSLGDGKTANLENLRITPEEHQGCPGHAAHVFGGRTWQDGEHVRTINVRWYCTNWPKHGHKDPYGGRKPAGGPMTEAEKAERREVIANNKEWASASEFRRSWLFQFVQRRTPPAGAELFIYRELLHTPWQMSKALESWGKGTGHEAFRDVMGLDREADAASKTVRDELNELIAASGAVSPKRATLLTAAMLLCSWHYFAGVQTWRGPSAQDVRMLRQMQAWDYPLADVEVLTIARYEEEQQRLQAAESGEA